MKWIGLMLLLCGCASQMTLPPPQVSTAEFEVQPFPGDLYLISYKGTSLATERAMDLALLKASQMAQEQGYKYFVIIDRSGSQAGEVKYRASLPGPGEWKNELLIQGFKARPRRMFCFLAAETEQAIYEKLRTAPQPEQL